MAVLCARCGTQNPDGNQFCQACGTPLVVTAPLPAVPNAPTAASPFPPSGATAYSSAPPTFAGPPPGPPAGPPPAFQSPYYAPGTAAPQPPVHRAPWLLIIGVIAALVLVMAGVGAVLAFAHLGQGTSQANSFKSVSSPSPEVSPTPGGTPRPSPAPTPPTGPIAANDGATIPVPSGWSVLNKDGETITLESPTGDGAITVASGPSSPAQSAQQNKDTVDKLFESKYPDTKTCPNSKVAAGPMAGVQGIFWELCFTLTSGAQSIQAGAPLFVAANAKGNVYYAVYLITTASNMDKFIAEATPIMKGIVWHLK